MTSAIMLWMFLSVMLVIATLGHEGGDGCGDFPDKDYLEQQEERKYYNNKQSRLTRKEPSARNLQLTSGPIDIELVFHVIQDQAEMSLATVFGTDENIRNQVDVLNEHFSETRFRFLLKETIYTTNDDWGSGRTYNGKRATELARSMVGFLRVGGPDVANIFLTDGTCQGQSFASLPYFRGVFPQGVYSRNDYIFLCPSQIIPGDGSNNQTVLTHEMGHWLGLLHTFHGNSCDVSNANDLVFDTPQQSGPTQYSDLACLQDERNSCPGLEGTDPIHNFMDYSTCREEFTPGQMERMYQEFNEHRRRIEPCQDDQMSVRVELHYDDNPEETSLSFTAWGTEVPYQWDVVPQYEYEVDLANQMAVQEFCFPTNTLYEFVLSDSESNGFQSSPAYFALFVNGKEVANTSSRAALEEEEENTRSTSFFVAGGSASCAYDETRWQLELSFDGNPSTVSWELVDSKTTEVVVDSAATRHFGANIYYSNMQYETLHFDQCLFEGEYDFVVRDTASVSYLTLSKNGDTFHTLQGGQNDVNDTEDPRTEGDDDNAETETVTFTVSAQFEQVEFGTGCFPGRSTVEVFEKGSISLDAIKLGDLLHVGQGEYEPVYSFGHYDPAKHAAFVQMRLEEGGTLELTHDHLVFLAKKGPIPASFVRVGDKLLGATGTEFVVKSTQVVTAGGLFAPFTPSGRIIVNGVLASSFVSLQSATSFTVLPGITISHHWLAHSFEIPHRLVCRYAPKQCQTESYTESGLSTWVAGPRDFARYTLSRHWIARHAVVLLAVLVLLIFNLLDILLLHNTLLMSGIITCILVTRHPKICTHRKKKG